MENKEMAKILWALNGPIVTAVGGWGDKPPKSIVDRIRTERMIAAMKKEEKATITEALWYMSSLSFLGPLDQDGYKIMAYLMREFSIATGKELMDFLKEEIILDNLQDYDLQKLRTKIYNSSMKVVLTSMKGEKETVKAPVQQTLLDFIKVKV